MISQKPAADETPSCQAATSKAVRQPPELPHRGKKRAFNFKPTPTFVPPPVIQTPEYRKKTTMKLEIRSEFQPINPFVEQSPFLLFYNKGTRGRIYQVHGLGCVTPHISKATCYEIDTYQNELGVFADSQQRPVYVTIPVWACQPHPGAEYEFYAGKDLIPLDSTCGKSAIHQAACAAKRLARLTFRPGGPFGAVVQTAAFTGPTLHVAYFGIDLLFYPLGNIPVPNSLEGFTQIGDNHFTSIPRYW